MIYLLDATAISDWINNNRKLINRVQKSLDGGHIVGLSQPVYYEVRRGMIANNATGKLRLLENEIRPTLDWIRLRDEDWMQASQLWADLQAKGRKVSDMDILLASVVQRLDAIIVTSDNDFDALPIKREDWR